MGPGHFSKCGNEKDVITCRRKNTSARRSALEVTSNLFVLEWA